MSDDVSRIEGSASSCKQIQVDEAATFLGGDDLFVVKIPVGQDKILVTDGCQMLDHLLDHLSRLWVRFLQGTMKHLEPRIQNPDLFLDGVNREFIRDLTTGEPSQHFSHRFHVLIEPDA